MIKWLHRNPTGNFGLAGYEDSNDAEQLCNDPVMCRIVGGRAPEQAAASTSQMGRFETETLTQSENCTGLMDLPEKWIDRVSKRKPAGKLILDLDSSVSPTHGHQEGSSFNGHFACTCYHPLFCFNQHGDLERPHEGPYLRFLARAFPAALRPLSSG